MPYRHRYPAYQSDDEEDIKELYVCTSEGIEFTRRQYRVYRVQDILLCIQKSGFSFGLLDDNKDVLEEFGIRLMAFRAVFCRSPLADEQMRLGRILYIH